MPKAAAKLGGYVPPRGRARNSGLKRASSLGGLVDNPAASELDSGMEGAEPKERVRSWLGSSNFSRLEGTINISRAEGTSSWLGSSNFSSSGGDMFTAAAHSKSTGSIPQLLSGAGVDHGGCPVTSKLRPQRIECSTCRLLISASLAVAFNVAMTFHGVRQTLSRPCLPS